MGTKGDKMSQTSATMAELMKSKLQPIGDVTIKKMFGGHGMFHDGKMFGLVDSKGMAFMKVDESNKSEFVDRGAQQHSKMPYCSIPETIINEQDLLIKLANKSIAISK